MVRPVEGHLQIQRTVVERDIRVTASRELGDADLAHAEVGLHTVYHPIGQLEQDVGLVKKRVFEGPEPGRGHRDHDVRALRPFREQKFSVWHFSRSEPKPQRRPRRSRIGEAHAHRDLLPIDV